jgi:hypothetical protein
MGKLTVDDLVSDVLFSDWAPHFDLLEVVEREKDVYDVHVKPIPTATKCLSKLYPSALELCARRLGLNNARISSGGPDGGVIRFV